MDWKDVASAVGSIAPALGAALAPFTGGISAAAGVAVGALGKAIGKKDGEAVSPQEVLDFIATDPEWKLKMIQAENSFLLEMRKLDLEEYRATLGDISNARQRQLEHEKVTGTTDWNMYILAWTVVVGFFVLVSLLMYWSHQNIPLKDNTGALFMLLGSLSTGFGMVLQYFFGSSKSSTDKTNLLAKAEPIRK